MLGTSTFELAMKLLNWLPLKLVDRFLLMMTKMMVGDAEKCGLKRPKVGPLELKMTTGKTPVLDVGALSLIKKGSIRVPIIFLPLILQYPKPHLLPSLATFHHLMTEINGFFIQHS